MASAARAARLDLHTLPRHAWVVAALLLFSVVYAIVQVGIVRPHLWPAGTGAALVDDPAARFPVRARPPDVHVRAALTTVERVAESSPADRQGIRPGDRLLGVRDPWTATIARRD